MQIVRTIFWIFLLVGLLVFSFFNWNPVEVKIWDNLVLETKVPALVIVSFLLGLIPMWLIYRGMKWRLTRRIAGLENATLAASTTPSMAPTPTHTPATTPVAPRTSTPAQPESPVLKPTDDSSAPA